MSHLGWGQQAWAVVSGGPAHSMFAGEEKAISGYEAAVAQARALFIGYEEAATDHLSAKRHALPEQLCELLPEMLARFDAQQAATKTNGTFARGLMGALGLALGPNLPDDCPPGDYLWIEGALSQLRREWTDAGAKEREQCFGAATAALMRHLPPTMAVPPKAPLASPSSAERPLVLVPGAGLGRLNFDLSLAGDRAVGVERAMTMLLVSRYVYHSLLPSGRQVPICP